jgi:hypothetical protein
MEQKECEFVFKNVINHVKNDYADNSKEDCEIKERIESHIKLCNNCKDLISGVNRNITKWNKLFDELITADKKTKTINNLLDLFKNDLAGELIEKFYEIFNTNTDKYILEFVSKLLSDTNNFQPFFKYYNEFNNITTDSETSNKIVIIEKHHTIFRKCQEEMFKYILDNSIQSHFNSAEIVKISIGLSLLRTLIIDALYSLKKFQKFINPKENFTTESFPSLDIVSNYFNKQFDESNIISVLTFKEIQNLINDRIKLITTTSEEDINENRKLGRLDIFQSIVEIISSKSSDKEKIDDFYVFLYNKKIEELGQKNDIVKFNTNYYSIYSGSPIPDDDVEIVEPAWIIKNTNYVLKKGMIKQI